MMKHVWEFTVLIVSFHFSSFGEYDIMLKAIFFSTQMYSTAGLTKVAAFFP